MLYCALRDPQLPVLPRLLAFVVVAYALSPIDLIPDFIPLLGYLDDVILLPLGIWLVIRLTPVEVLERARAASAALNERPVNRHAAVCIVLIWILSAALMGTWFWQTLRHN